MTDEKSSSSKPSSHHRSESPERPSKVARFDAGGEEEDGSEAEGEFVEKIMIPKPGMQRYLVAVEYIGTRFSGAQKQPNCRTVVGVLEAFRKFIGQPVSIFCSSRTDAGVHALSNVCHVDAQRISKRKPDEVLPPHEPSVVKRAVNHFLQKNDGDIMVVDVRCVPADFHARYKAQERTYFYRLLSGSEPLSAFEKDRAWHIPEELDVLSMRKACRLLVGRHDFSSFRAAACQAKSPIRTLEELTVTEVASSPYFPTIMERTHYDGNMEGTFPSSEVDTPDSMLKTQNYGQEFGVRRRHHCVVVTARARSFLYHQVRLLVGVLKAVGTGNISVSDVERILEAKDVAAASPMAPACGLYLGHVKYDLPSS
ncbi:uncharacterized protein LOC127252468 isoform X2 [Andrographis paniculata]|uniref:uncharacterized protein LOC127252468 isoform X2 n=1 Tax=Andrographis paniculata TaxID=175694 RepID=UPI0021E97B1E|nr:uncharacterized protein LOC127252468 isoform X2 [Andrographis paniculata]